MSMLSLPACTTPTYRTHALARPKRRLQYVHTIPVHTHGGPPVARLAGLVFVKDQDVDLVWIQYEYIVDEMIPVVYRVCCDP